MAIIQPSSKLTEESESKNKTYYSWWLVFVLIVALSYSTHLFKLAEPAHVCWDETHFGKMGSWYINRTFFFDVHPPLGKMLIALSGYLTGYDGKFGFEKPGHKYENVTYVGMRAFCAAVGSLIAPFGYLTVWEMTGSLDAATFAALFILLDVGVLTLTRYILLDPLLLCFMMGTLYGSAKFRSLYKKPFSSQWWNWLLFTGFMMACCMSVKFVGLFTILLLGLQTIEELWNILGDLEKSLIYTIKHFCARFFALIVVPVSVYVLIFYIHLTVLNRSGLGDGHFSSAFQSKLIGNSLYNSKMPRQVAYGAIVSLKNYHTGGGYLHSHHHLYPEGFGARQQQITTYFHKDQNNHWLIKPYDKQSYGNSSVKLLRHGDFIRLEHLFTKRNLHSHKESAPIMKKHYQVTAYGVNGTGDGNDIWQVLIDGGTKGDVVTVIASKLKFIHFERRCLLATTGNQLPKWAFDQQEVVCNQNLYDKNSLWNIEENIYSRSIPTENFRKYAPNFFEQLIESHALMFRGNANLRPKEGEIVSRPWQWPLNYRGILFSGKEYKIYLLGNPIIWWGNLIFLGLFLLIFSYNVFRYQRGYRDAINVAKTKERILKSCFWLFAGWVLNYSPFWSMGRVLYYHHYFPALLFNSMLSGVIMSYFLESVKGIFNGRISYIISDLLEGLVYSTLIYSFYLFAPLSYGMGSLPATEPNSTMYGLRWLQTWEF